MNKPFKHLTIQDIASICNDNITCETCSIAAQCATLFKQNPETWAYFNKEEMTQNVSLRNYKPITW